MPEHNARAYVVAAVGVVLSTMVVGGASGSGAFAQAPQVLRSSSTGTARVALNPGTQLWAKRYNGTGNNADIATSVAVSPTSGTVYVTGWSYAPSLVTDYATVAYTASGTRLWVARYNGPTNSTNQPTSVAVSPNGKEVVVTGASVLGQVGYYATVAYDTATGHQVWAKLYGPVNGSSQANGVAVSPDAKTVYVTGQSAAPNSYFDYATVAYDAATGNQRWAKRYNDPLSGIDQASSLVVNPVSGTLYVTGASVGSTGTTDYATFAYSAAGAQQWAARYKTTGGYNHATSVALSGGTVAVTGSSLNAGANATTDYATVAYDATTGHQLWAARYNGTGNNADQANAVAISGGTVYVTGRSAGTATTGADYATVSYAASSGHQLWAAARYNDPGNGSDGATSLAVRPGGGSVYVTGQSQPGEGYTTVAYSPATGRQLWAARHDGSELYRSSVAVSSSTGTVFVAGMDAQDYITIAYQG